MTSEEIIRDIEEQISHIEYENKEFICSCCITEKADLEIILPKIKEAFKSFKNLIESITDFEVTLNNCDAFDITDSQDQVIEMAKALKQKYFPKDFEEETEGEEDVFL